MALGVAGRVRKVVVDTSHFKGNYPDACTLEACNVPNEEVVWSSETAGDLAVMKIG